MDKTVLYSYLRRAPFGGKLSSQQVKGVERLLKTWGDEYPDADLRWIAYSLASIFHETGGRMWPARETFASSDAAAKRILEKSWAAGKLPWVSQPYWRDGWFGRGDIQLTHQTNYRRMGLRLGVDLVNHPELALDPTVSAQIAIVGMVEGLYTGKKLADYFGGPDGEEDDPVNARKIVNGLDKAKLIAGYYKSFLDALVKATSNTADELPDAWEEDARPDDSTPTPKEAPGMWTGLIGLLTGIFGAVTQVNDPYAFAAVVLIIVSMGVFGWGYLTGRINFTRK